MPTVRPGSRVRSGGPGETLTDLPRDWLVLSIPAPPADQAHLLVDALRRVGARAVERQDDGVMALFSPPDDAEALVAEARMTIRAVIGRDPHISWRRQPHAAWAERWRREQPPRRIGRIVVAPVGVEVGELGAGDLVIRLDPAAAFGTSEHATTRACLGLLDSSVRPGDRVLDLGAGSGILAIAAALLGAGRVLAVEADPVACDAARRNVAVNRVADRVRVSELEVGPREVRRLGRHDVVAANLQAPTLLPLVPALPAAMKRDGTLILSGIIGDERAAVVVAAGEANLSLAEERQERGWWTGMFVPARRDG